ncbi:MAG: hydrogenase 4 subunit F [Thermodesulfobacteriota bacterium]
MPVTILVAIPFISAFVLALVGDSIYAPEVNICASGLTAAAGIYLSAAFLARGAMTEAHAFFHADALNVYLACITAVVSLTTAIFSRRYMRTEIEQGHVNKRRTRFYHVMFQMFIFSMLLAMLTNNFGVMWIATELATLSTVLLISLYRTPTSIEAAWKYFILCGVGIALALFGTVLLYFAAESIFGEGEGALLWTNLYNVRGQLEPNIMRLTFIFFIVGYGTKVGLAPMHNWLPDAHSESPTPISALLSGLLLNVALYAVLRMKILVDGATGTAMAGHIMMGFGLLSLFVAAFSLLRQRDIKRLFAYSSIEHMGLATFAFGLGGQLATFAALLHMLLHSLTKSAIFFTVGSVVQRHGTKSLKDIRGLIRDTPFMGWGLLLGVMSIAGMPPFGIFISEFLILTATIKSAPLLSPLLIIGLAVAFAAILSKAQQMVSGPAREGLSTLRAAGLPIVIHITIIFILGLYIPALLSRWIYMAVEILK